MRGEVEGVCVKWWGGWGGRCVVIMSHHQTKRGVCCCLMSVQVVTYHTHIIDSRHMSHVTAHRDEPRLIDDVRQYCLQSMMCDVPDV